ncbi:MAG: tyrosine-type recombinase/integrase [Ruminococcus flavefaciens]|nr:tyrosine-type recombinase/integrase [Ruminococcus flavefaciens]MCM1060104.1 tyrosine-type recombinase/integrase [Eubacterium sp.]
MPERSRRIELHDSEKLKQINSETQKFLQKYQIDMSLRGLSEKTQYHYKMDLNQWFIYILDNQFNQSVTELSDDDITEFLYFCKRNGNNVERMKRRISAISAFYKFLRKKKLIQEDPTEFLDRPKKGLPIVAQTFLTEEQVALMRKKLIEYGALQLRTYALFSLSTMARVSAVANIKWKQIDFDNRIVRNVLEKEGKIVELFFSKEVKELLLEMKSAREADGINDFGWVFFSGHNTETQPITNCTLNEWCKKIGRMIGVPSLHPHDFRHSGASLLKNAGMPLEDVSALLNHNSTDVTKKFYIKEDVSRIKKMKDKFNI